ncbi:MAG: hypothetical protein GXO99_02400 [Nitrospirae bacterium]|nr:hypothetical protein [Nitrospirota bacterium]
MKKIPIDKAKPGMVLAEDVVSQTGVVLFPKGIELSEKNIQGLSSLGIDVIGIEGKSTPRMTKRKYLEIIEQAFKRVNPDPFNNKIKEILIKHVDSLYEEA